MQSIFSGPLAKKKSKVKRSTSQTRYVKKPEKPQKAKKVLKTKVSVVKKKVTPKPAAKILPKKKVVSKKTIVKLKPKEKKIVPELYVGEITHYFQKISVVVVKVTEHPILIGDLIHVKGSSADFTQKVVSLQVESKDVRFARKGELVGLQVSQPAKPGDKIYKIKK